MATELPTRPAVRPGGRSARVRAAVHRAVEELVAEGGVEAVSVPVVAERAGVHPTSVYRRWGSAQELVAAVAVSRLTGEVVVPDTGTLRGDLHRWTADVLTDLADPEVLALLRAVIGDATRRTGTDACLADRRAQLEAMLDRERDRGGSPPDADALADALLGPIYFRALFDGAPLSPLRARALVDRALV